MNRLPFLVLTAGAVMFLSCASREESSKAQDDPERSSLASTQRALEMGEPSRLTWPASKDALVELLSAQKQAFLKAEYPQLIRVLPAMERWTPPDPREQSFEKCPLGRDAELRVELPRQWFSIVVTSQDHRWEFYGAFRRRGDGKWTAHITHEKKAWFESLRSAK
jgi:hypothetical protein